MISERDLAEKFSVIWKEHFPLLTPNYMKIFNETRPEIINNEISESENDEIRYDLISQLAFNCAEKITSNLIPYSEIWDDKNLKKIIEQTAREIWRADELEKENIILSEAEKKDCQKLCKNIVEFITKKTKKQYHFKPKFNGYGIISNLIGDLSIDDTLYEIKTVKRNFRSSDLKQLIIYLALAQMDGNFKWKYAGLYNPRKGNYCKIDIEKLVYNLSGGKSTVESFKNLLDSFSREVNIDSKF